MSDKLVVAEGYLQPETVAEEISAEIEKVALLSQRETHLYIHRDYGFYFTTDTVVTIGERCYLHLEEREDLAAAFESRLYCLRLRLRLRGGGACCRQRGHSGRHITTRFRFVNNEISARFFDVFTIWGERNT